MYGVARVGKDASGVTTLNYWTKIKDDVNKTVKKLDEDVDYYKGVADFYKDVVHNTHGLLDKQDAEITRLKTLLEKRVLLQQEQSASGLNAPNPGDDEDRVATDVFPEEVWRILLNEFVHPRDIYNCYLTCTLFSEILEPAKTGWLFANVFPIICHHLVEQDILNCRATCKSWRTAVDLRFDPRTQDLFASVFPLIYHHLKKRDILSCRATCKRWMTAVDLRIDQSIESATDNGSSYILIQDFFKNYDQRYPPPFAVFNFPSPFRHYPAFDDEQDFQLLQVDPAITLHPRNPFLGRSVSILEFFNTEAFVNEVLGFLENVGQHISYLMIRYADTCTRNKNYGHVLQVLNQSLVLTPNLKVLNLDLESLLTPREVLPNLCCPSTLETLIINALPSDGWVEEMHLFADLLFSDCSQHLVRLEICFWSQRFITFKWPNLKEMKLRCVRFEKDLLGLLQINLPALKLLQIIFSQSIRQMPSVYHHLLQITNHFPELSTLELGNLTEGLISTQSAIPLPEDLYASPHLTTLKVLQPMTQGPLWRIFLLRFPFLKYLYIQNDGAIPVDRHGCWSWYPNANPRGDKMEITTASIWKLFPRLQMVVYGNRCGEKYNCAYTRDGCLIQMLDLPKKSCSSQAYDEYLDLFYHQNPYPY